MLRKTTRKHLRDMLHAEKDDLAKSMVKDMLSGVKGTAAAAGLVTLQPAKKKKLRYTFNTALREQRLQTEVEDETDDEEEEEEVMRVDAAPVDESAVEEIDLSEQVEQAGMKKHPSKPLPKRGMSASYYDWQNKALAQPNSSGMFDPGFDGRLGNRGKQKMRPKGKTTKHQALGSHSGIFDRLDREAIGKASQGRRQVGR